MKRDDTQSDVAGSNQELQESLQRSEPRIMGAYGLIGAILLFGAAGYGLDHWMHSSPWFVLIGLLTGMVLGFSNLIRSLRRS